MVVQLESKQKMIEIRSLDDPSWTSIRGVVYTRENDKKRGPPLHVVPVAWFGSRSVVLMYEGSRP